MFLVFFLIVWFSGVCDVCRSCACLGSEFGIHPFFDFADLCCDCVLGLDLSVWGWHKTEFPSILGFETDFSCLVGFRRFDGFSVLILVSLFRC